MDDVRDYLQEQREHETQLIRATTSTNTITTGIEYKNDNTVNMTADGQRRCDEDDHADSANGTRTVCQTTQDNCLELIMQAKDEELWATLELEDKYVTRLS